MTSAPRGTKHLDTYCFHERDWDGYDELRESFEWVVPDQFNIATHVCGRWVGSDRTALLVDDGGETTSHTFADLQALAGRCARYLDAEGVERGDRVAVSGAQRVEVLAAHLACWTLGAVSVPLSMRFGREALRSRLVDSGATAVLLTAATLDAFRTIEGDLPALETTVVLDSGPTDDETTFQTAIEEHPAEWNPVETDPSDPAIIMYTSGTTGDPKGVVLPHQHLLGVLPPAQCGLLNLAVHEDDVGRTPVEWSWAGSLVDVVLPLLSSGISVVASDGGPFDPERELDLLEQYGVTITAGPPTVYRLTFGHPAVETVDLTGVRVLALGGEAAGDDLVDRARDVLPNASVHEVYGQSEAPLVATDCEALGVPHRPGKMGKPAPGYEVRVVDPESREMLDSGEVGEFAVRRDDNPGCFTRYWNDTEETAAKVADGWQFCEDLGSIDEDDYLDFHSRTDDVIISSGYKIGPGAVEDTLVGHEAVAGAGVIGVPDETRGELVTAYVELAPGVEPSAALQTDLEQFVKDRLAQHEYPRALTFVDELPRTPTGKVRRQSLRERHE